MRLCHDLRQWKAPIAEMAIDAVGEDAKDVEDLSHGSSFFPSSLVDHTISFSRPLS